MSMAVPAGTRSRVVSRIVASADAPATKDREGHSEPF
jgi:hypothetical protein